VEWLSKAISYRLQRPYYLRRDNPVQKVTNRKQRTDIGNYSFVNRTIKNWNQLTTETLVTFLCKLKIFRKRFRKAFINGMK
jgi:hypothetical protein